MSTPDRIQTRKPGRQFVPPRRLRAMTRGRDRAASPRAGILLIAVGAILLFALTAQASPRWIDLHAVGIIVMVIGLAWLVLSPLTPSSPGDFRRWVVPMLPAGSEPDAPPKTDLVRRPGASGDHPTLADDLLRDEDDALVRPQ